MTTWSEVRLGEVLQLQRGFDITKAQQRPGPVPVVSSSGVGSRHDTAKCHGPGVVVGRKGSLGTVFYVDEDYWPHDTTLWVRDFKGNDPRFCYFLLKTLQLAELDAGASNPTLNRNHAHLLPVRLPVPFVQGRVAEVLHSFDELIESNRRRIEIVEEAARSLYQEWFVHFRFPGHESATFVDSPRGPIPEGWRTGRLSDVLELRYGKALKAADRQGGPVAVVGSSGVVGHHHQAMADGPGIVVGRKGHVGSVIWLNGPYFPIDTTYFVASANPLRWLRYLLENMTFENSHSAVPGLNRSDALRTSVLRPQLGLTERFDAEARPLLDLVETLQAAIAGTAAARDELLPRLVTGLVDVRSLGVDDVFGWAELAGRSCGRCPGGGPSCW